MSKSIKPIETTYNGYRFRSRLEARWAVFFDTLGIVYEYEPEGFELESGKRYLPDFLVRCYGLGEATNKAFDLYVEVKGKMSEYDLEKIEEFYLAGNLVYVVGSLRPLFSVDPIRELEKGFEDLGDFIYTDYFLGYEGAIAIPNITTDGRFYLWNWRTPSGAKDIYQNKVLNAVTEAMQKRFEFGE